MCSMCRDVLYEWENILNIRTSWHLFVYHYAWNNKEKFQNIRQISIPNKFALNTSQNKIRDLKAHKDSETTSVMPGDYLTHEIILAPLCRSSSSSSIYSSTPLTLPARAFFSFLHRDKLFVFFFWPASFFSFKDLILFWNFSFETRHEITPKSSKYEFYEILDLEITWGSSFKMNLPRSLGINPTLPGI